MPDSENRMDRPWHCWSWQLVCGWHAAASCPSEAAQRSWQIHPRLQLEHPPPEVQRHYHTGTLAHFHNHPPWQGCVRSWLDSCHPVVATFQRQSLSNAGKSIWFMVLYTRNLGARWAPISSWWPSATLLALRACLTSSFTPFGHSSRVTHADDKFTSVLEQVRFQERGEQCHFGSFGWILVAKASSSLYCEI